MGQRLRQKSHVIPAGVLAGPLALVATLAAAPAAAQSEAVAGSDSLAPYVLVFLLVVAAAAAVFHLQRGFKKRLQEANARADAAESGRQQGVATLATAPAALVTLSADDKLAWHGLPPPGLDVSAVASLADLLAQVEDKDRAAAAQAIATLRQSGKVFDLALGIGPDGHPYCLSGARASAATGATLALWLCDRAEADALEARAEEAERQALEAERGANMLLDVVDSSELPMWRRGADLQLIWCNAAYARIFGQSVAATVAKKLELEVEMTKGRALALAGEAMAAGGVVTDVRQLVIDNRRRALRIFERPDPSGESLLGHAHDITEIEDGLAELKRHIEAHAEVLNSVTSAIVIFGADKKLAYFNRAFGELWQLDEDWLAGGPDHGALLLRLRDERKLPETGNFLAYRDSMLALYTDLIEPMEDFVYRPDGRVQRRMISPHPFGGLLIIEEDVTDALALERSYNTLIAIQGETLDNLFDGVGVFGSDGLLKLFNPAYARIWQLDEAFLKTQPHARDIVAVARQLLDDGRDWGRFVESAVAGATSRNTGAGRMVRTDEMIIDFNRVPLPDGSTLLIYQDVTDSKRMERILLERALAFEEADRLKRKFISSMSYRLRTPLTSIIGYTEFLTSGIYGKLSEQQGSILTHVREASDDLQRLIDQLLDLAIVEGKELELKLAQTDIRALLLSVSGQVAERARRKDIAVAVDCPDEPGSLLADPSRLNQVLLILTSNAIDYTEAGGRVTLGAARTDGAVEIWVEDTGRGIPPEEQDTVFEHFEHGSNVGRLHGIGVGLTLAKGLIDLHGGEIELSSTLGQGTRVLCRFPEARGAEESGLAQAGGAE